MPSFRALALDIEDMRRNFRQVDVFGEGACTGNPVIVILDAEGLADEVLRRFSVWSNLSECTFVLPQTSADADYRVRIFSLNSEPPFAGHPTLGTARAWLDAGGVPSTPNLVIQECDAGLVPIRIDGDRLYFSAPPRLRSGPVELETLDTLIEMLGIDQKQVLDAECLDNGPEWVGLLVDHADTVLNLHPDTSRHPGRCDIGLIGAHNPGSATLLELRAFFTDGVEPLREDPVTGSLNAAAAEWLTKAGYVHLPYVAAQGTTMGRRGRIHVTESHGNIWVGGRAEIVLSGAVTL